MTAAAAVRCDSSTWYSDLPFPKDTSQCLLAHTAYEGRDWMRRNCCIPHVYSQVLHSRVHLHQMPNELHLKKADLGGHRLLYSEPYTQKAASLCKDNATHFSRGSKRDAAVDRKWSPQIHSATEPVAVLMIDVKETTTARSPPLPPRHHCPLATALTSTTLATPYTALSPLLSLMLQAYLSMR